MGRKHTSPEQVSLHMTRGLLDTDGDSAGGYLLAASSGVKGMLFNGCAFLRSHGVSGPVHSSEGYVQNALGSEIL